ncbi:MAG: nodulation protein NfeD [Xanthomonadales bacterium]|nr:nodulation protein NfeD [Xanthomonadales bacterium]
MDAFTRSLLLTLLALLLAAGLTVAQEPASAGRVYLIEVSGGIGPATSDHIRRGIARAQADGATAVVLRIDTPGGLDAATRDINQALLAAQVPVIGYVAPEGARAASAGTFILYATHLAAMAPATSLGAASPVAIGGGDPGGPSPRRPTPGAGKEDDGDGDAEDGTAMSRKVTNDAVAYLRGIAERRGRDVAFAEAAVRDAATLTAREALERGVIEIVATDLDDLLRQADGRTVRLGERETTLALAGAVVETLAPDWRNRLLSVITDPSIAYFLLLIGLYGLVFEGYNPGALVPGVVGAISLLLALYALQVLPVNYAGIALILLGVVLMTAELFLPSFGTLGIGGVVALVAGSVMLFDTDVPGFGVPRGLIGAVAGVSGLAFLAIGWLAIRARRRPVVTGRHELIGHAAIARNDFDGHGHVRIRGENWQARSSGPVRAGETVVVTGLDGLVLLVRPGSPDPPSRP